MFLFFVHFSVGQNVTYVNYGAPHFISALPKDIFYSSKIHEITLKPDSTFEFLSRPHISCFTWKSFKGTWKKIGDTLLFFDKYQIEELDTKVTYQKNTEQSYQISFSTNENSRLDNSSIKVEYVYDYNTKLENLETTLQLTCDKLVIPFIDIPNIEQLASIRIEYLLTNQEKRYAYLTENRVVNIKGLPIPNIINVQFLENPEKELVFRITKAVLLNDNLVVCSTTKTRTFLRDYYEDLQFENHYNLIKQKVKRLFCPKLD